MFMECPLFESDLSGWNVSQVENMEEMFSGCCKFNSDFSNWDVSNLKQMTNMFSGCPEEKINSDVIEWGLSLDAYMSVNPRVC